MALEKYIGDKDSHIPTSPFLALLGEYVRGVVSAADIKTYVEEMVNESLDSSCTTDLNTILSSIDGASDFAGKMSIIMTFRDVMDLAEYGDISIYKDDNSVKTRLGFV